MVGPRCFCLARAREGQIPDQSFRISRLKHVAGVEHFESAAIVPHIYPDPSLHGPPGCGPGEAAGASDAIQAGWAREQNGNAPAGSVQLTADMDRGARLPPRRLWQQTWETSC